MNSLLAKVTRLPAFWIYLVVDLAFLSHLGLVHRPYSTGIVAAQILVGAIRILLWGVILSSVREEVGLGRLTFKESSKVVVKTFLKFLVPFLIVFFVLGIAAMALALIIRSRGHSTEDIGVSLIGPFIWIVAPLMIVMSIWATLGFNLGIYRGDSTRVVKDSARIGVKHFLRIWIPLLIVVIGSIVAYLMTRVENPPATYAAAALDLLLQTVSSVIVPWLLMRAFKTIPELAPARSPLDYA